MKIGVVSLCARRGQKPENLEKIVRYGEEASECGCRLAIFPEYSVNGPWVTQAGATTPATVPIGAGNAFLRAAKP